MITYRTIDNIRNKVFKLVTGAEGFKPFIYYDSVGVPTLGYGFAMLVRDGSDLYKPREVLTQ